MYQEYVYKTIRIWDLVNKLIYKQINYDAKYGYEIIQWKNNYAIVRCQSCFVIIDIEKSKIVKKVTLYITNNCLFPIREIKISQLGECLICSDNYNKLFSI